MLRNTIFLVILAFACTLFSSPGSAAEPKSVEQRMVEVAAALPVPYYPPGKAPETKEQRDARVALIASVVAERAPINAELHHWFWSSDDLALAAFTMMWFESGRFKLSVHSGKQRGDSGRSTCLGQIMNGGDSLVGTGREATTRCVDKVMEILAQHQNRCLYYKAKPSAWGMASVYAGYGTGHSCNAKTFMYYKDKSGNYVRDKNGNKVKNFWALRRGWMWWQVRRGFFDKK